MSIKLPVKILALATCVAVLSGCAVGRMLTSGYTPPPLVDGLDGQQSAATSSEPTELSDRKQGPITLDSYKGELPAPLIAQNQGAEVQPWHTPSSLFQPSFVHKSIEDYAAQLAMELLNNNAGLKRSDLIGVGSFVRLDRSLQQTNILGNQLSEYFISEIQQFGLSVIDYKAMDWIKVTSRGDFVFTRDSFELAKNLEMDHMLSGTMIDKPKGVQINARIIAVGNKRVVASASILIPHFITQRLQPHLISSTN